MAECKALTGSAVKGLSTWTRHTRVRHAYTIGLEYYIIEHVN